MTHHYLPSIVAGLAAAILAPAAVAAEAEAPIQDNSFLVEEAYNQEFGVVQHISTFQRPSNSTGWMYTFTQEWPAFGQLNQLSYTLPIANVSGGGFRADGLGDLMLNYRLQAMGDGDSVVAFSPRVSLSLPTGEASRGLGSGTMGYQVNLPLSVALGPSLVAHTNVGATYFPSARNQAGDQANALSFNVGQSLIWLLTPQLNPMLEAVWNRNQSVAGPGRTDVDDAFILNPGVRGAWNLPHDLQVVPGLSLPMTLTGARAGEVAVFAYLSLEHPFMAAEGRPEGR